MSAAGHIPPPTAAPRRMSEAFDAGTVTPFSMTEAGSSSRTRNGSVSTQTEPPAPLESSKTSPAAETPSPPSKQAVEDEDRTTLAGVVGEGANQDDDREKTAAVAPLAVDEQDGGKIWVEFPPGDPENPFNYSKSRKWIITALAVFFTAEVAATASAYVPGIPSMEADLGIRNHELSLLGIAIYPLGFSLPPLILAPLSEVFGRNPIYLVCHFCYTVIFVGIGRAKNIETVLVLRFLQGAFGSTGSTMVGGTLADIWMPKERGEPMALFATAAIFGTGIGPVWAGFVEQNTRLGWRWIEYLQAIYTAVAFFVLLFFLRETRGSTILTRRAKHLRHTTGDARYMAHAELERASVAVLIRNSLTRPLVFLVQEPIVTAFSLWIAFTWGFLYMLLSSIGLITGLHHFTPGQTGLVFLSICLAAVVGNLTNPIQERLYHRFHPRHGLEARLYFACIGAVLFPAGCLLYGWTSFARISIAGPFIGVFLLMLGVYHIYLAVFNYLADAYLTYASSALAAQSFARNIFGFAFPLFVEAMYRNLGYQWASTLAACLGALLGAVPFILFAFGKRIRAKSKISLALQAQLAASATK